MLLGDVSGSSFGLFFTWYNGFCFFIYKVIIMKRMLSLFVLFSLPFILSGCIAAVAGAAATGGYVFAKNYKVEKK